MITQIQWTQEVYVDTANVDITVQDEYVSCEVQDFDCEAQITVDVPWLISLTHDELKWLIKESREVLATRDEEPS